MKAALLLHGFLGDSKDYGRIIDDLNTMYDHVEIHHYPGHTDENPNYWRFYAVDTIVNVIACFDNLQKEYSQIDVIGYSMGGAIAVYLSGVRPVHKLVLLAPAYHYLNPLLLTNKLNFNMKYFKKIVITKNKVKEMSEKQVAKMELRRAKYNSQRGSKMFIKKYLRLYINKALKEFATIIKFINRNSKDINCPTLICYGKLDELVPYKSIADVYDLVKNDRKEIKTYDNMTHLMLLSLYSDEIKKDVISFIGE